MGKTLSETQKLFNTVIKNNYCIGCGACTIASDSPFEIKMDDFGNFIARQKPGTTLKSSYTNLLSICPFSGKSKNENELGELLFPDNQIPDDKIGKYLECHAGYVNEANYRAKGSSGGFGKWIGYKLLETNKIDYFIQLVSNNSTNSNDLLFDYKIFNKPEEIFQGSKSSYYPSTLQNVLRIIKGKKGKYAITGVPCFVKALRLLALHDQVIHERVAYTIGIVCGGMKSANHAKMIGWELGVHPDNLIGIDFRKKLENQPATQKGYQVWSNKDNIERYKNANEIYGTDYGAGYFKPKACDFCDDVVAETADISFGDAWLPGYREDPEGNSMIIIRNQTLLNLIEDSIRKKEIFVNKITAGEAIESQAGGFRHRREALSLRIAEKEKRNEWYPIKRISAGDFKISKKREKIYKQREKIAEKSHICFLESLNKNSLPYFYSQMNKLDKEYKKLIQPAFILRAKQAIRRRFTH